MNCVDVCSIVGHTMRREQSLERLTVERKTWRDFPRGRNTEKRPLADRMNGWHNSAHWEQIPQGFPAIQRQRTLKANVQQPNILIVIMTLQLRSSTTVDDKTAFTRAALVATFETSKHEVTGSISLVSRYLCVPLSSLSTLPRCTRYIHLIAYLPTYIKNCMNAQRLIPLR